MYDPSVPTAASCVQISVRIRMFQGGEPTIIDRVFNLYAPHLKHSRIAVVRRVGNVVTIRR